MPLMVAIIARVVLKEPFSLPKVAGLALIVLGAVAIVWINGGVFGTRQNVGHGLFLAAGFVWACYTVALRHAGLEGLHAAAIAAVGSLVLYVPVYAFMAGVAVFEVPVFDIALQAIVQGVLTAIVALLLYGRVVSLLGTSAGAGFVALTPALTAIIGIPILGEWPSAIDWLAIATISIGVYAVSGGPPPRLKALPSPTDDSCRRCAAPTNKPLRPRRPMK
jgi:drug/metabolite transporter (DMT)-like permease